MIQRRSFIAALIGAALAPRLILEPMRPEARALIEGPAWADGGMLAGAGRILEIMLMGMAAEHERADFSAHRNDGSTLMRFEMSAMGGLMRCIPHPDDRRLIFRPDLPILLRAHETLDGHVMWQPLDGSTLRVAQIKAGILQTPVRISP